MFKSNVRPIAIPQLEHARLSGVIAQFWGNETIDPPPVDPVAFALGVTDHDRGYGPLDTLPIGEADDSAWLATQVRGIQTRRADPIADAVSLLHILRLVARSDHPDAADVVVMAEARIRQAIARTNVTRGEFDRANEITHLCDSAAFVFCFEQPTEFDLPAYSGGEVCQIRVTLAAGGEIRLDPWPLAVPELRGFILGYDLIGYPDNPQPLLLPYTIRA